MIVRFLQLALVVGLWLRLVALATAAPPPTEDEAVPETQATQIQALIDGTLDASVDPTTLFTVDLSDPELGDRGERLVALLTLVASEEPPPPPKDDSGPWAAYEAAVVRYMRLEPERRDALLAEHAARRREHLAQGEARAEVQRSAAESSHRAAQLEAYLAGELDVTVDPATLLTLDLADRQEVGLSPARRGGWLAARPASEVPAEAAVDQELADAQLRLDLARRRFMGLSADERSALRETHQQRVEAAEAPEATEDPEPAPETVADPVAEAALAEELRTAETINAEVDTAETAAAMQERALERMRLADSAATAAFEEAQAELLGVTKAQALYAADVNRRKVDAAALHTVAADWAQRVVDIEASTQFEAEKAAQADPLYDELRSDLSAHRDRLRDELSKIRSAGEDVPAVGPPSESADLTAAHRSTLSKLRSERIAKYEELQALDRSIGWEIAQSLRDDVVLLNRARLSLLEMATPAVRDSVTGFGSAGVDQARREFAQISLELSFHALKIQRYPRLLRAKLNDSAIPVLIGVAEFALVLAGFVWWRRRGNDILARLDQYLRDRNPVTAIHQAGITALWYLRRVRRPLVVLLVLWLLVDLVGNVNDLPEVHLLWIVALWVLAGLAVILFVDALAARETRRFKRHDNSKLRIHSLRVVGINVIAVGLILSLTSAMVGKGAIYSWVISTCWILSFPVAVYLVHRWRPIIVDYVQEQPEQTPFTKWVIAQQAGLVRYAAATAGAAYLLGRGVAGWAMRQLSEFEATRRLLAYLFRREVAKQAAATLADERYHGVDEATYALFDPEGDPAALLTEAASKELARIVEVAGLHRPTLSVIVGERGAGKSIFVKRLRGELGDDKVRVLSCPEEGFEALEAELAALTDTPTLRGEALCTALRELELEAIVVDDLQRLVVPAVKGLDGLDRFTTMARSVGGQTSWVVTIGSASWHYIRRARGERVFFEHVVTLPRWSEEQLGELLQAHCGLAKIEPSYDGLVVPRQASAPPEEDDNRTETGYFRLLWDFSKGNPAVALHAFRESLFVGPDGSTVVRLFKEPSPEEIEDLSPSLLFVLRSVVQLELAMAAEVEAATQFPRNDVDDALRFCVARGYLEPFQGGVRVTWPWYRTITTVLQRQHLLSAL